MSRNRIASKQVYTMDLLSYIRICIYIYPSYISQYTMVLSNKPVCEIGYTCMYQYIYRERDKYSLTNRTGGVRFIYGIQPARAAQGDKTVF